MKRASGQPAGKSRRGIVVMSFLGCSLLGVVIAVLAVTDPFKADATGRQWTSPEERLLKAKVAYADGDLEGARIHVEEFLEHDPAHIGGRVLLARVHLGMRRLKKAEEILGALLKEKPEFIKALRVLADVFHVQGRSRQVIGIHRKIVELAKDDARAFADLGLAQHHGGDSIGAIFSFRRSLGLDPAQPDIRDLMNQLGTARSARPGFAQGTPRGGNLGSFAPPQSPGGIGGGFGPGFGQRGGAGSAPRAPDPFRGTPLEGRRR